MATPVIMPKFGMAQEEGTIIRWLKQEGERVEKGETLLEVQTDKVDMEVEATTAGVLRDIRFGAQATVPVTTVIALLASEADEARIHAGESIHAAPHHAPAAAPSQPMPSEPAPSEPAPPVLTPAALDEPAQSAASPNGAGRATPVAQRVAQAHGLSLDGLAGSGPAGRITRADVERANAAPTPAAAADASRTLRATPAARRLAQQAGLVLAQVPGSGPLARIQAADVHAAVEAERAYAAPQPVAPSAPAAAAPPSAQSSGAPLAGMRRTIARRVAQSWTTIPHIFITSTIDMTRAEALRALLAPEVAAQGAKLTPTVLLARAAAAALLRHPRLNAHLVESQGELHLVEHRSVNLGVAVALEDGLVVPVVRDVQSLGLQALAEQMADLAQRARAGRLLPADVEGGTFSLSSLHAYPVEQFTALIFPPQVAILAVGRMATQPVWEGGAFAPRPMLTVTLSADHRAVDGAVAGAFLATFKQLVEEPERLLL